MYIEQWNAGSDGLKEGSGFVLDGSESHIRQSGIEAAGMHGKQCCSKFWELSI